MLLANILGIMLKLVFVDQKLSYNKMNDLYLNEYLVSGGGVLVATVCKTDLVTNIVVLLDWF